MSEQLNDKLELNSVSSNSIFGKQIDRSTRIKEEAIRLFFLLCGMTALVAIVLIFVFLFKEGIKAVFAINVFDFVSTEVLRSNGVKEIAYEWYPTSEQERYSLIPLILGTLVTAIPAVIISTILGVSTGIYLSEIADRRIREFLKPAIELVASIPTVVLGFFMLVVVASLVDGVFHPINRLNALVAALGLSIVIIPVIASLTEDALRSIPNDLRMASYGLGATKWQTIARVIVPAAFSGVSASILLGFGRAIGETMIVLMAAGNASNVTIDVFRSVRTMTATIAAEMGEVSRGSNHYYALFFIGLVLFIITFFLNLIAEIIVNRMRKKNTF